MKKAVFCIAKTQTQAEAIVNQLKMEGFLKQRYLGLIPGQVRY